ncbi:hypothetical protein GJ496_009970 [Pomphorhynchus laevis]|nr:hypothetical protein GJ496_009970 [Pomphorhynchus laevis]
MKSDENQCALGWTDYLKFNIHSKCSCDRDLHGTLTIITGANSGIGYEATKYLADKGSKVIMACRSVKRATEARETMQKENPKRVIQIEQLDVSSLASVRSFAKRIRAKVDKIDLLINNAGVLMNPGLSEDGFEIHFATNYLGHFLLTNLLLDTLKKSPDARIINVSSSFHLIGRYNLDKVKQISTSALLSYANSKLYNVMFTNELKKRLQGTTVTAYSLNPGAVATNITYGLNDNTFQRNILPPIYSVAKRTILKTPLQGIQTILHIALNKNIKQYSGDYFSECGVSITNPIVKISRKRKELWRESEQYAGLSTINNLFLVWAHSFHTFNVLQTPTTLS